MYPLYFRAILKTEDDKILEHGYATVSSTDGLIDFKNEFVPLMKIGSIVKIVRVLQDAEKDCFVGEVYLSSRNMLRIISTDCKALQEAQRILSDNTSLPVRLGICPAHPSFFSPNYKKLEHVNATIYSLSTDTVKFISLPQFSIGQDLMLQLDEPVILRKVILKVMESIKYGEVVSSYLCKITSIPEDSRINLFQYIDLLSKRGGPDPASIPPVICE